MASYQLPGGSRVGGSGERVAAISGYGAWQDTTPSSGGAYTLTAEPVSYTLTARSAELTTSGGEQLGRSRKSWFAAEREAAERAREDRDTMDVAAILAHLMDGELI